MEISKHAEIRCQQRGIPFNLLTSIVNYGTEQKVPGNCHGYRIDKLILDQKIHELKREIDRLQRLKKVQCIVAEDGTIVTTYKQDRKRKNP